MVVEFGSGYQFKELLVLSKGTDQFELRLGKLGLAAFVIGISCLIFAAFQFGIMIGKDMDAYPEKAAEGLPAFIKQKIIKTPIEKNSATAQTEKKTETVGDNKAEMDLTFYDTLAGKKQKLDLAPPKAPEEKAAPREETTKEPPPAKDKFFVQVVSLKDQSKAEDVRKKLAGMGYTPELDLTEVGGGKFYRVKLIGFENREEAGKAAADIERKLRLKCMVKGKE